MWWNEEGIYILAPNEQGELDARSLTDKSIRSFFLDIPTRCKLFCKAGYDSSRKVIKWLYCTHEDGSAETDYNFDSVLSLNLLTGAFYNWTIDVSTMYMHDVFSIVTQGGPQTFNPVYDDDGVSPVVDDAGDSVVVSSLNSTIQKPTFKYLVSAAGTAVTFAETNNDTYYDWYSYDNQGVDFTSTFTTGYRIDSQTQAYFQSNYVFVFLKEETNASCLMQGRWDWTTSSSEGKWSTSQQLYSTRHGNRALHHRRLKVRGKGKALQLNFTSEAGKPFSVVGWSIWETANEGV